MQLREMIKKRGLDGLIVGNIANIRYLSGFSGSEGMMLLTDERDILITDFRYVEQVQKECRGVELVERKRGLIRTISSLVRRLKLSVLGFEADSLTYSQYAELKTALGRKKMVPTKGMVECLREVKDDEEVKKTRMALEIAEAGFQSLRRDVRQGVTEKQLADGLESAMKSGGAVGPAFNTIVAVGERSSLPHAPLTERKIGRGDMVLVDWGASWQAYNSDLTRVLFLNRISAQARKIYGIVLNAQKRAIDRVRGGVSVREVDLAARSYIEKMGYGSNFGHGLGHGIGLDVHENPRLNRTNRRLLKRGMVITVEPGIYIPNWGGVRIEDMILVKEDGCEVLSRLPKDLDEAIV
ncbi:MAG: Xaa-Pro peptidase family protein [Candidatus Brocadiales bacterium]|nr:Xaa-Pro peptidase family protein [Candidatus Brocadiales bacterium]